jgi:hypothetical protein
MAAIASRQSRATFQRWGVAAVVFAHLLLLALLELDFQRSAALQKLEADAEFSLPTLKVQLTRPWRAAARSPAGAEAARTAGQRSAAVKAPSSPASNPVAAAVPATPPAEASETPAAAPGEDAPDARVVAALRASLGCNHAALAHLTPEERQGCQERLAGVGGAPLAPAPLGLTPEAKEAFDLAVRENKSAHIPMFGCFATFGMGKIQWYHPSRGVKLGKLPCYIVAPKGVFLPDKPPAKGFMDGAPPR